MSDPKFKIGDMVEVLKCEYYTDLVGKICKVKSVRSGTNINKYEPVYMLDTLGIIYVPEYELRESKLKLHEELAPTLANLQSLAKIKPKKVWDLSKGKPNFCVGCSTFNEYQPSAYVCYQCENGI